MEYRIENSTSLIPQLYLEMSTRSLEETKVMSENIHDEFQGRSSCPTSSSFSPFRLTFFLIFTLKLIFSLHFHPHSTFMGRLGNVRFPPIFIASLNASHVMKKKR